MIADELSYHGYKKARITADSAEAKSIEELKGYGVSHIKASKKGPGSINAGIQYIQNFEIIIDPHCVNFITEINNSKWKKDKFGKPTGQPEDSYNHLMDALRYGLEEYQSKKGQWII